MRILRHHLYDGGGEPEQKEELTIRHGVHSGEVDGTNSEIGVLKKQFSEETGEKAKKAELLMKTRSSFFERHRKESFGNTAEEFEKKETGSGKALEKADLADPFQIVGIQPSSPTLPAPKKKWYKDKPVFSLLFLAIVIGGCLCCNVIMTKDPTYMDLMNYNRAPDREFLFGTDTMGRDIFSMIWYGGRISLFIGLFSTLISTVIAVVFGGISGIAPQWLDTLLMRLTEILLSIPNLLLVILLQAILGTPNVVTISVVIGVTSWTSIAKVVRTEVRQIRRSEYVIASRCMGGGFFHLLWHHLAPNFVSSIMFMVVMNIRSAIVSESTLSFMGIGLPLEIISWGSMLSLSEKALLTGSWWIILIPGVFLVVTLLCMTEVGNYLRRQVNQKERNL